MPVPNAKLYVKRDLSTSGRGLWRCAWWDGEDNAYCYAEGECSARYHRTARAAIAFGQRVYRETAKIWPRSEYV